MSTGVEQEIGAAGCPRCGADRLKSAPLPVVDGIVNLLSSRRRYRCSGCGWTGRRHRLRRRGREKSSRSTNLIATLFAGVIVLLIVLIGGGLLFDRCSNSPAASEESVEGA